MDHIEGGIIRSLKARGAIRDCTDEPGLDAFLAEGGRISAYAGFDPTAPSLHVGHLATLSTLRAFARAGHRAVAVIGTATALIGDPTGRTEARPLLGEAEVERNASGVERSIRLATSPFEERIEIRRNGEWLSGMGWLRFLREVGSLVPVRRVLSLDGVRARLDGDGMSFLELAYPLMQAFDFLTLSRELGPLVQIGGSDQWGNICAGLDLIARSEGARAVPVFGLTHPLLTRSDGTKMGKTSGGAIWLNPEALADFDFFRFWRTLPDADAPAMAHLVSDLDAVEGLSGGEAERFKEGLAIEMTTRLRGAAAAEVCMAASRSRGRSAEGLAVSDLPEDAWSDLLAALASSGLASSRGAARRLLEQGGVRVNGEIRREPRLEASDFMDGRAVLSAGRTRHVAVRATRAPVDRHASPVDLEPVAWTAMPVKPAASA